jgi:SAM-dependent methyltransferase
MTHALELYEQELVEPCGAQIRFEDGTLAPLPVARYLAAADPGDQNLLSGVTGPVLDVGCGPGRHLRALTAQGVYALGVDLSPVAVEFASRGGARAVVADVFGEIPGAGSWATALLLDGNIGIGGRPLALLRRLGMLLVEGGTVLVELEAPEVATGIARARIETDAVTSGWFRWARVSVSEIGAIAAAAGMNVEARWQCGERWFARLGSAPGG